MYTGSEVAVYACTVGGENTRRHSECDDPPDHLPLLIVPENGRTIGLTCTT